MIEIIFRMEREEMSRLFTSLGGAMMNLMQQRAGPDLGVNVDADARGRLRGLNIRNLAGPDRRDEIRSVADVLDVLSRLQSDQGGSLFPPVEGEHEHQYVFLHTEHGNDIYACQHDGCDRRMTIPGRIIQPAPIEETPEVTEHERDGDEELPGLPPGRAEEIDREEPPS